MTEADGNDSFGSAQTLPLGASVLSRISPVRDHDWYRITVPIAGLLHVIVDKPPDNLNLVARIWNSDVQVERDWQGASRVGGAVDGQFSLSRPGDYWIEVADGGDAAASPETFPLVFDFRPSNDPMEPDNNMGQAVPVPLPLAARPSIFPQRDHDWLRFWVPEPGLFRALVEKVPDNLDIVMRLWDLDGNVVRDWQGPPRKGGDTELDAELRVPGVYMLEMADGGDDAENFNSFQLSADFVPVRDEAEPDDSFADAANVEPSSRHKLAIFPLRDEDWLSIDVDHPGELKILATDVPAELDIVTRIWNANKDVIRDWVAPLRKGGDNESTVDLPKPGRYFIEVSDGGSDASSPQLFDFALAFRPEPDQYEPNDGPAEATPLTPGGEILFNILPVRDHDWFRIDLPTRGELAVSIDHGPDNLDLIYRVWNGNREVIRDWVAPYRKGGLTEGLADLPATGTYFIEVADGGDDAGSIEPATLKTVFTATGDRFEPDDSFGQAAPVAIGDTFNATILPQRDSDWFKLDAPRAGQVVVTVDQVDEALDVVVRLWDANGNAGNWVGPPRKGGVTEAKFPVNGAGTYRLEIRDGGDDSRSPVAFRVQVGFE